MSDLQQFAKLKIKYMAWVLAGGFLLLLVKFYAWQITGSVAIFSDALESIVNVISGTVALLSLIYAAKPKDSDHPYGHGKIEFIAAGFEGGLIFIAGIVMIVKGTYFLFAPKELESLDMGIALVFFSGLANGFMGLFLVRKGKKLNSPTLSADGKHLLTDTYTSIGLLIALVLIYFTGIIEFDGVISIIFGIWILFTGYGLVRNSIGSLLDKTDEGVVNKMVDILNSNRRTEWIDIHNLRIQKYGSDIHVDCHLTLPWYYSLREAHEEVSDVNDIINREMGIDIELFIHTDPCLPHSCSICSLFECQQRKRPFKEKVEWSSINLQKNQKHNS